MPGFSKETAANQEDHGPVIDHSEEIEGYTVQFVTFKQEMDGAPMMKGLVDDRCQCPHWGYVLNGTVSFKFADHEETFNAGDAFYVPPGHTPANSEGAEYLQFSPTAELKVTSDQIMENMKAMQAEQTS